MSEEVQALKGVSLTTLEQNIRLGSVDRLFRRSFILYALTVLLCPTSKNAPTPALLDAVADVSNPSQYNWGQLVLDWLINKIQEFRAARGLKKSLGGCMFFLMVCCVS